MFNTEDGKIVLLVLVAKYFWYPGRMTWAGLGTWVRMRLVFFAECSCGRAGGAGGAGRGYRDKRARPERGYCCPRGQLGSGRGRVATHTHTQTHADVAPHVPRAFPSHAGVRRWKRRGVRGTRPRPSPSPKHNSLQHTTTPPLTSRSPTRIKQHDGSAAARCTCMHGALHCVPAR
jgi:hypothetical protein